MWWIVGAAGVWLVGAIVVSVVLGRAARIGDEKEGALDV